MSEEAEKRLEKAPTSSKKTFFEGYKTSDLLATMKTRPLRCLKDTATAEEALQELAKYGVQAMPVKDADGKIRGILSTADIIAIIIFVPIFARYEGASNQVTLDNLKKVITNPAIYKAKVRDLIGMTEESRVMWEFWDDGDLKYVAERLSRGVHKVMVNYRDKTKSPQIVTQTDIVRFIQTEMRKDPEMSSCFSHPLSKFGVVSEKKVVAAKSSWLALACFRQLWEGCKRVHDFAIPAVPVVDEKGRLLATLSASDMRGMTKESLPDLMLPIMEFLKLKTGNRSVRPSEAVTLKVPLRIAIEKLLHAGIHRLWIVDDEDEQNKVGNVLSMTDIIRKFVSFNLKRHPDVGEDVKSLAVKVSSETPGSPPPTPADATGTRELENPKASAKAKGSDGLQQP
mmetsp:Transcript_14184/g.19689  ORF Transcript_14184/g.19689 Transcript_14184/m.19689 type:complete len:398 (+) Transcript_14184:229-1422(+)|eukprot:CAMPEP_0184504674 /NCGR_PEP_ID=MMETSP0113_2-20130426/52583_1 /TAXON_ID=91329 /ORGANISM="Norrisiella sphaerica, Strain BC52" /LENGTH=397 /DNA_ID=CAMNT_0026894329 /DNA_START=167 /DNA_END=1360 /DNA_ORIENTATION=+